MPDETQIFIAAVALLHIFWATWKVYKKDAVLRDYVQAILSAIWAVLLSNVLF
jgi:hypothetical protein